MGTVTPTHEEIQTHLGALNKTYVTYCDVAAHWYESGYHGRLDNAYKAFMAQSTWFERNGVVVRFVGTQYVLQGEGEGHE